MLINKSKKIENKSDSYRENILQLLNSAEVKTIIGFSEADIQEMKRLGELLKEASKKLSESKTEMLFEHKQGCFEKFKEIQAQHEIWWEQLTVHRNEKEENFFKRKRENLEKNIEICKKYSILLDEIEKKQSNI